MSEREGIYGSEQCPHCINERLVRAIGNLLVCPSCDVIFVKKENVNNFVGKVEVLPESVVDRINEYGREYMD